MPNPTIRPVAVLMLISALVAGCGGTSYGNDKNFKDLKGNRSALGGETSPSPSTAAAAPTQTAAPTQHPTVAPVVAPTKSTAPTPPKPQAQHFAIAVNGDNSGQPQFSPPAARVYVGTILVFTNKDSVPRSVVSDNDTFNSGSIAPGASWNYTASTVGTFNYHDGTRPYAVAYFQVVAQ
ncbi:MAG: cupredoxin domain-containing protein [Candidatus Dormibacteria bacterium]